MLQPKPNLLPKPSLSPRESTTQMTLRCDFYLFAIYGEIFLIVLLQTEVDYLFSMILHISLISRLML